MNRPVQPVKSCFVQAATDSLLLISVVSMMPMFSFTSSTPFANCLPRWSQTTRLGQKIAIALLSSTVVTGNILPMLASPIASPESTVYAQRQGDWDAELHMARLLDEDNNPTALVLQLDVDDKPDTTYANAVYQVFAKVSGRWTQIYTNTGARLIGGTGTGTLLPPEVIELVQLEEGLGDDVSNISWDSLDLKAVVQVRYDTRSRRDRQVMWEREATYSAIAQTYSTQIATTSIASTTAVTSSQTVQAHQTTQTRQTTQRETIQASSQSVEQLEPLFDDIGRRNNQQSAHRGHFNLGIFQKETTLSEVIARVSLKSKRTDSYLGERLIGDFKYTMNERSQFIRGLNPGDRVVVRLFDVAGTFLGYSEFELLEDNAAVNLILSDNPWRDRLVRTVYGIDSDRDGLFDTNTTLYDYFSHVTYTSRYHQDTNVTFLRTTNNINLDAFNVYSVPRAQRDCSYPNTFQHGSFAMVNRRISAFHYDLAEAFIAPPGELVQITEVSSSQTITSHEVSRLLITHREVGFSDNVILTTCDLGCSGDDDDDYEWDDDDYEWDDDDYEWDDDDDDEWDDDDDYRRHRRRSCNQGRGNGSEGCDPGRSRPHGGSNDGDD